VQLTGYLGADPEIRYLTNESRRGRDDKPPVVTTFRVASGRQWKDGRGERHEETEWFKVVAWDRLAEVCAEYLNKGTRVYVEGRLQTRKYTDRDGIERYATEVVASDMIILSSRGNATQPPDEPADDDSLFPDPEPPASSQPAPPPPAPTRTPARAGARTSAPNAPRPVSRNQPQPIEDDDSIPF
jgi:single-strand DNA-binding protein